MVERSHQTGSDFVRPLYKERGKQRLLNYRQMAIGDFMNPPTLHGVRFADYTPAGGGPLLIDARDDFEVVRVHVVLRNPDGVTLSEGDATLRGMWLYPAPAVSPGGKPAARIEITAYDRPGNVATMTYPVPDTAG